MGLLPSPGERLSGRPPFSWRIRHVSGAKGIASRFPKGGGGARSALKSRGRRLCHRPRLFVWQAGGPKAPRPPNAAAPGAAAAFSIPGDTLPPREDEPPPLDLFPILGREGGGSPWPRAFLKIMQPDLIMMKAIVFPRGKLTNIGKNWAGAADKKYSCNVHLQFTGRRSTLAVGIK